VANNRTLSLEAWIWELADIVLDDLPEAGHDDRDRLAEHIQQAIEAWIAHYKDNYEPRETGDAWTGGFAENH
jgi:hypothetical protein